MARRPFKSGSENIWASALQGALQGYSTRQQMESMAAERELKKQAAEISARAQKTDESKLRYDILKGQKDSSTYNPLTQSFMTTPGMKGVDLDAELNLILSPDFNAGTNPPKGGPPVPPALPASNVQELSGVNAAREQLRGLVQNASTLGFGKSPIVDRARGMNPLKDYDPESQAFEQHVAATKQIIGKGLEGGVLRKEDEVKYEKIIPKRGDLTETLIKKAEQLDALLENKARSEIEAYTQAGMRGVPSQKAFSPIKSGQPKNTPAFATEQEAEASGYKGPATIGGRPVVID